MFNFFNSIHFYYIGCWEPDPWCGNNYAKQYIFIIFSVLNFIRVKMQWVEYRCICVPYCPCGSKIWDEFARKVSTAMYFLLVETGGFTVNLIWEYCIVSLISYYSTLVNFVTTSDDEILSTGLFFNISIIMLWITGCLFLISAMKNIKINLPWWILGSF